MVAAKPLDWSRIGMDALACGEDQAAVSDHDPAEQPKGPIDPDGPFSSAVGCVAGCSSRERGVFGGVREHEQVWL